MSTLTTTRLQLHPIGVPEGQRIVARTAGPTDAWADDFPFEGDLAAIGAFLRATAVHGEQQPFGYYRISRLSDGRAIGGTGFNSQPEDGRAEIGYGLVPSARGHGYAAEAVVALLAVAAQHGAHTVIAESEADNVASQRTLVRAGFRLVRRDGDIDRYEAVVDGQFPGR